MAEIIPFRDIVHARRRDQQRALTRQCIALLEANLQLAVAAFTAAPQEERAHCARRIRILGELLEYAVRCE
jgi:transcription elongation GreA/GreB family factor